MAGARVNHPAVAAVAQLPNQFGKLDLDHVYSQGVPNATNALTKASAESSSSLQVRIVSFTSGMLKQKDDLFADGNQIIAVQRTRAGPIGVITVVRFYSTPIYGPFSSFLCDFRNRLHIL